MVPKLHDKLVLHVWIQRLVIIYWCTMTPKNERVTPQGHVWYFVKVWPDVWSLSSILLNSFPFLSSTDSKIRAIEAKLKMMEKSSNDTPTRSVGKHPLLQQSERNKLQHHPYKQKHPRRGDRGRTRWPRAALVYKPGIDKKWCPIVLG